jgi:hypothetical protein
MTDTNKQTDKAVAPKESVEKDSSNALYDDSYFKNTAAEIKRHSEQAVKLSKDGEVTPQAKTEFEAAIKAADAVDHLRIAMAARAVMFDSKELSERNKHLEYQMDAEFAKLPAKVERRVYELRKDLQYRADPELIAELDRLVPKPIQNELQIKKEEMRENDQKLERLTGQTLPFLMGLDSAPVSERLQYAERLSRSGDLKGAMKHADDALELSPELTEDEDFVLWYKELKQKLSKFSEA